MSAEDPPIDVYSKEELEAQQESKLRIDELALIERDIAMAYPDSKTPNDENNISFNPAVMNNDSSLTAEEIYLFGGSGHGLFAFANFPASAIKGMPLEKINQRRELVNEERPNYFLVRTNDNQMLKVSVEYLPLSQEAIDNKYPSLTFKVVRAETILGEKLSQLPEDINEQILGKVEKAQQEAKARLINGERLGPQNGQG